MRDVGGDGDWHVTLRGEWHVQGQKSEVTSDDRRELNSFSADERGPETRR